jgi:hypothetical protein
MRAAMTAELREGRPGLWITGPTHCSEAQRKRVRELVVLSELVRGTLREYESAQRSRVHVCSQGGSPLAITPEAEAIVG